MLSPFRYLLIPAAVAVFCYSSLVARAQGQPADATLNDPVFEVNKPKSDLRIVEKFAKVLKFKKRITTVAGFDQQVVNVSKVDNSPKMIRVHAEAPGVTTLAITDEDRNIYTISVFVIGDVRHLQAYLNQMFPNSAIQAVAIRDTVILRGWVSQPEHITEIREIATEFYGKVIDQMKVGGVQQVQLKVRVMEVQRAKIRRLGFNFLFSNADGAVASTPGQVTPLRTLASTAATVASVTNPTVAFSLLNDDGALFQGFLEALKDESLLKILAEPELVTTNGRPAHMVAGGEFPILVPQSLGTVTINWREFGVRLSAVPIILGRGRVRLELEPEVSERDFTNAVQVNGTTVPGLTTRRVNTQVEMRFGETFMIAGLLSMRTTAQTSKIPILGELPWVGAAFRRVRYEEGETELVIMVTPELVSPMKCSQIPPGGVGRFTESPLDRELYIDGAIEVPNYSNRPYGPAGVNGVFSPSYPGAGHISGVEPIVTPSQPVRTRVYDSGLPASNSPLPMPPKSGSNDTTKPQFKTPVESDNSTSMRRQPARSYTKSTPKARSSLFPLFRRPTAANARSNGSSGYNRTGSGLIRPASGDGY